MKVKVYSIDKKEVGDLSLNQEVFNQDYRPDILHQVVTWQLAKKRLGTHQTKEVDGIKASTRKIYSQKGTGRARHGSVKAPQFRGGATVFGPHVRDHGFKLNKKIRRLGLKVALSEKLRSEELFIVDNIDFTSGKTKDLSKMIAGFLKGTVLLIDLKSNELVVRAASNLHKVNVLPEAGINVYDLLNHNSVLITTEAVKKIEERLQ